MLSDVVENVRAKSIQLPEELSIVNRWDILMLLIPSLTKEKVKTQKKNFSRLSPDSMLFLCIDTIVRMFLNIVYLDSRPEMPNDKVGVRSFKYLIRNKLEEIEELENELEKVKEAKGMISEEEHREEVKELKKIIKEKDNEIQRLENKIISERDFVKEKQKHNEERLRKQIEYEMKVKEALTD